MRNGAADQSEGSHGAKEIRRQGLGELTLCAWGKSSNATTGLEPPERDLNHDYNMMEENNVRKWSSQWPSDGGGN